MKKIIIIISIIVVSIIFATGIFVATQRNNISNNYSTEQTIEDTNVSNSSNSLNTSNLNSSNIKYTFKNDRNTTAKKTKIYYYNPKDTVIEKEGIIDGIKIPQINGLKDKEVENKINNKIIKKLNEFLQSYNKSVDELGIDVTANFSNVVSINCIPKYKVEGKNYLETDYENTCAFTFELVTGEELKFNDLFRDDIDINEILVNDYNCLYLEDDDVSYDQQNDRWITYNGDEYVVDEYDIIKYINKKKKELENGFYFYNGLILNVPTYDLYDDLTIFDRYETVENIFEKEYTTKERFSNRTLFVKESDNSSHSIKYIRKDYALDNLYYDIRIDSIDVLGVAGIYEGYFSSYNNMLEKKYDEFLDEAIDELNSYIEIAKNNPNKMYILTIFKQPGIVGNDDYAYNAMEVRKETILLSCDYNLKEEKLSNFFEIYDYDTWYDASSDHYFGNWLQEDKERKYNSKNYEGMFTKEVSKQEYYAINLSDNKVYKKLEYFPSRISDDEALKEAIKSNFFGFDLKAESIIPHSSEITDYGNPLEQIIYRIRREKDLEYIYEIDDETYNEALKKISNKFTLDELEIAYNEIFARHGHEFSTASLKEHFESCSWYNCIPGKKVSLEELTTDEQNSVEALKRAIAYKKSNN